MIDLPKGESWPEEVGSSSQQAHPKPPQEVVPPEPGPPSPTDAPDSLPDDLLDVLGVIASGTAAIADVLLGVRTELARLRMDIEVHTQTSVQIAKASGHDFTALGRPTTPAGVLVASAHSARFQAFDGITATVTKAHKQVTEALPSSLDADLEKMASRDASPPDTPTDPNSKIEIIHD